MSLKSLTSSARRWVLKQQLKALDLRFQSFAALVAEQPDCAELNGQLASLTKQVEEQRKKLLAALADLSTPQDPFSFRISPIEL